MRRFTARVATALSVALCCLAFVISHAKDAAAEDGLVQHCAKIRNDDTVRGYEPSLRDATIKAFKALFPDAKGEPDPSEFETQAHYRCMDGRTMVCFVGANLPCAKINTAKNNRGATAFCKENANAEFVPAFAIGHDSAYSFKCSNGKAVVDDETWKLDKRGFAQKIWTALSEH